MFSIQSRVKTRELQNEILELTAGMSDLVRVDDLLLRSVTDKDLTLGKLRRWVYPQYFTQLMRLRDMLKATRGK